MNPPTDIDGILDMFETQFTRGIDVRNVGETSLRQTMRGFIRRIPLVVLFLCGQLFHAPAARGEEPVVPRGVPAQVQSVLESYCVRCHGEKKQKGHLRLDDIAELTPESRLDLLGRIRLQTYLEQMPPEDEKQPTKAELDLVAKWIRGEQLVRGIAPLEDELRYPDRGNWVSHEKLFSGEIKDKPYSPARRWLVSPQIFQERVNELFELDARQREAFQNGIFGLANPFTLPERSGVRDYDITALDSGNLFVMMNDADWIAQKQIRAARVENGEFKAGEFQDKRDRWYPKATPPAFEKIILSKSLPSDQDLSEAVRVQFDHVLHRPPSEPELSKYLALTRSAINLAGNSQGLGQMLSAVLLESEFVYRVEFGQGVPDQFGRRLLSPREASFAIAYAIGDRGPDAGLQAAADQGRLNSKADYEREVKRLLADQDYFRGSIDPSLNNLHWKSQVTSHPKIVRFFRDFFGYPKALRVFKDGSRSGGYYTNPDRGSPQTPGMLVNEADMFVDWYVNKDKNVFENLLGGDQFFAAPVENAQEKIDALNELYEKLKATDWKKNPKAVLTDNQSLVEKCLGNHVGEKQFVQAMEHIVRFRQKGLNPHPIWNYPFGRLLTTWVASYNIDQFNSEYLKNQPCSLPNRMGILTHPAWLIAFSNNSATDPVRRGKWIREKLLAGSVPNVPITVDARIPDDAQKTLRERLDMVSHNETCWRCHQNMNPLGVTFEGFDDFGRFRTAEILEHPDNVISKGDGKRTFDVYKTKPVDTSGNLSGTGDPALDGDVKDAHDLIGRLVKSTRVRQSIIRYAFRYYMGRNETLSDSPTLIDADRAYVASGGSFNAVIVSLLTSDSFMYRK